MSLRIGIEQGHGWSIDETVNVEFARPITLAAARHWSQTVGYVEREHSTNPLLGLLHWPAGVGLDGQQQQSMRSSLTNPRRRVGLLPGARHNDPSRARVHRRMPTSRSPQRDRPSRPAQPTWPTGHTPTPSGHDAAGSFAQAFGCNAHIVICRLPNLGMARA